MDRRRGGEVGHAADAQVGVALTVAEDPHGRPRQIGCPLRGHDDHGPAAVRDEAAVEQVERLRDPPRRQHVLDGDRVAHERLLVEAGPPPRRDRHLGQLLGGRAVVVHVARGGQRVGADRRGQAPDAFELLGSAGAAARA